MQIISQIYELNGRGNYWTIIIFYRGIALKKYTRKYSSFKAKNLKELFFSK